MYLCRRVTYILNMLSTFGMSALSQSYGDTGDADNYGIPSIGDVCGARLARLVQVSHDPSDLGFHS